MKILIPVALCVMFTTGMAAGVFMSRDFGPSYDHGEEAEEGHGPGEAVPADEHEDEHLPLTKQAFKNLGLKLGRAELDNYARKLRIPGEVVEIPGRSTRTIAAPLNGVVTKIMATPGIAVRPGDALFELQVIDEPLLSAQLALLDVLVELKVVEAELERLRPLADAGSVAGKRKLDLLYQQQQLESRRDVRLQELHVRGLTTEQVRTIVDSRKLIRKVTVQLPDDIDEGAEASAADRYDYTVEKMAVHPGQTVARGEDLALLAYHRVLRIRGQAFEGEVHLVSQAGSEGKLIAAEFGAGGHYEGLHIEYVDNHVDPETQTFQFFVPLANEVLQDVPAAADHFYRTWRFKVGQRVHLQVPVERFAEQIVVPSDAVAKEGPHAFVFKKVLDHQLHADHADCENEPFMEFEAVPVEVLYQDESHTVLDKGGELNPGTLIALNGAYQLKLALEKQRSGGGGAHHHVH